MKGSKKSVSLRDHKNMMELMQQLYGIDDEKNKSSNNNTKRDPGTKGASEMAKLPPNCS